MFLCKHSLSVSSVLSCSGAATRRAAGLSRRGSPRDERYRRSLAFLLRAGGASRLTAGPNAETRSDHLSGSRSQSGTADMTLSGCFSLSWMGIAVTGYYSSKNIVKDLFQFITVSDCKISVSFAEMWWRCYKGVRWDKKLWSGETIRQILNKPPGQKPNDLDEPELLNNYPPVHRKHPSY